MSSPLPPALAMTTLEIGYVNAFVSDLDRPIGFFESVLGLGLEYSDRAFGWAAFAAGAVSLAMAVARDFERAELGRNTGIVFRVADLTRAHAELGRRGVNFATPPTRQPWGSFIAVFEDPDRNRFYLEGRR